MSADDPRPYRPCVGVVLVDRRGLVFAGRRRAVHGQRIETPWQMPQGGIDPGETPLDAAIRELYEETNVRTARLLAEAPDWYAYDIPADLAGSKAKKWRGQTQRWFAFRFEGEEAEIDVDAPGGGAHPAEFDGWRWMRLADLPDLVVPFKREVYRQVADAFRGIVA